MVTANVQFFNLFYNNNNNNELSFDTAIVEDIIYSGIRNYAKLAFNSVKMIRNDTVTFLSQSNRG